ncbi:MAG: tetratricopeptide repeat protein [Planctomycetota bacterium]
MTEPEQSSGRRRIMHGLGVVLAVGLAAVGLLAPAGSGAGAAAGELPAPRSVAGPSGAPVAEVDGASWADACRAARLPDLSDPSRLPFEPVRRLVEASLGWTRERDGDALGRMGEIYFVIGRANSALDLFAAAHALGADVPRWNYMMGIACQELGLNEAAIERLEQARLEEYGGGVTDARLGELLLETGREEEADERFRAAAQAPECPSRGHGGRARIALERGDHAAALEHADRAVAAAPRDYLAHRLRAKALAGLGRMEQARDAADRGSALPAYRGWTSVDPRLQEAHAAAATQASLETAFGAALGSGDLEAAATAGESLLERVPQSTSVRTSLAAVEANLGRIGRAAQLIEEATLLAPRNVEVLLTRAEIGIAAGRAGIAVEAARTLIEIDPNGSKGWALLARGRFAEGQVEEALEALQQAAALSPEDVDLKLLLADALYEQGRRDEARSLVERALQLDAAHPAALERRQQWAQSRDG